MKEHGLSPEDLASKAKRSFSTVQNWLRGADVSEETENNFASVLGVSIDQLRAMSRPTDQKAAV